MSKDFRDRVREAQAIVDLGLCKVAEERDGFARRVMTPGHQARRYWQIIRRPDGKLLHEGHSYCHITVECLVDTRSEVHCKGNEDYFCYHAMMALMAAAAYKGKRITLFQPSERENADRYTNLVGGKVYACSSHTSGQLVFAVMWDK